MTAFKFICCCFFFIGIALCELHRKKKSSQCSNPSRYKPTRCQYFFVICFLYEPIMCLSLQISSMKKVGGGAGAGRGGRWTLTGPISDVDSASQGQLTTHTSEIVRLLSPRETDGILTFQDIVRDN